MRNGNSRQSHLASLKQSFLSYLWGMETLWKSFGTKKNPTFLSYLWGMETHIHFVIKIYLLTFYPTYEEWKRENRKFKMRWGNTFYPTYEEWKLSYDEKTQRPEYMTFYPTYEEWKLRLFQECLKVLMLFILPMRNGNILTRSNYWSGT